MQFFTFELSAAGKTKEDRMTNAVERARRAANELLAAYAAAQDTTEREDVARVIAALTPGGGASIADLADRALAASRRG